MQSKISLLVGLKNNLDYSKHFYSTTRDLYPTIEICFASYGSTDGTHEWMDEIQSKDPNVKCWWSEDAATFSDTFNKAGELATSEYIAYLHNDIVLAPNFIENIEKHLTPNRVVSYTTIEPPIFAGHSRPGKLIKDFGVDLTTFNRDALFTFVKETAGSNNNKVEPGITFFMCMHKNTFMTSIGGMDNLYNPMFCEDDDLILRYKLLGLELITSLDAICYHFVSKTSRFSEEYKNRTAIIEDRSNRNFVRKWGFRLSTHNKKYDIGLVIKNCNAHLLSILEPWCSTLYTDFDFKDYVQSEQTNTKYDLLERIKPYDSEKQNAVLVEFDAAKLTQQSVNIICSLSDIITESGEVGQFELDVFNITIVDMKSCEMDLISL